MCFCQCNSVSGPLGANKPRLCACVLLPCCVLYWMGSEERGVWKSHPCPPRDCRLYMCVCSFVRVGSGGWKRILPLNDCSGLDSTETFFIILFHLGNLITWQMILSWGHCFLRFSVACLSVCMSLCFPLLNLSWHSPQCKCKLWNCII